MQPLLLTLEQTAELLGLSASAVRKLDSEGRIPQPVRLTRRLSWSYDELTRWVAAGCPPRVQWDRNRRNTIAWTTSTN